MDGPDQIPISSLQHFVYCPRQCALIYMEQTFDENLYTLRGRRVHELVDHPSHELIQAKRIERSLPLYSEKLGISGVADVVEFDEAGAPFPVEYKSGVRVSRAADEVQLCAQALCLEEMLGIPVPVGALYYDRSRRRREVPFTPALKHKVIEIIGSVRELFDQTMIPEPLADKRCPNCSLFDACMPFTIKIYQARIDLSDLFQI